MQPTRSQLLFTDDRPIYFLIAAGATVACVWTGSILLPTLTVSACNLYTAVLLMNVSACLGAMLGVFPGGLLLGVLLRRIEARNGAPFHVGDEVVILSKRFPGRITRVYQVWSERHQVRVELGDADRENVTDVFAYTDVCRPPAAR